MQKKRKIEVACPSCKKKFSYFESEYRPFCSKRCKLIDFGHWLNGTYAIPAEELEDESENEYEEE